MLMTNSIISIKKMGGYYYDLQKQVAITGVNCYLNPADNKVLTLYPDLPVGQTFSYIIVSDTLDKIPPESEFEVTGADTSGLTVGDKFQTLELAKKSILFGQTVFTGLCVKQ